MQNLLDRRADLASSQILQAHASRCSDCAEQLSLYLGLFDDEMLEKVEVASQKTSSRLSLATLKHSSGVLAAAVAIMVIVGLSYIAENGNRSSTREIASHTPSLEIGSKSSENRFANNQRTKNQDDQVANRNLSAPPVNKSLIASAGNRAPKKLVNDSNDRRMFPNISKLTPTVYEFPSKIPDPIEKLGPYYNYTTKLSVVRPWKSGINKAVKLIQDSIAEQESDEEELDGNDFGRLNEQLLWAITNFA